MACRDVYTGAATQIAHAKAACWRGNGTRVNVGAHAVGSKDTGDRLYKDLSHIPAIARDAHAGVVIVRIEIIGETLRRLAHGVDVHPIGASADNTAQSSCAKGELAPKRI